MIGPIHEQLGCCAHAPCTLFSECPPVNNPLVICPWHIIGERQGAASKYTFLHRTTPEDMFRFVVVSLMASLFFASMAVASASPASALDADTTHDWRQFIGQQLTEMIATGDEARQNQAMQLIIELKRREPTLDLSASADELFKLLKTSDADNRRILAVSALHALDNRQVYSRLRAQLQIEESLRVRRQLRHIVAAVPKYNR